MKKQALFVQGAGEGAHEADSALVGSLRRGLGPSYRVNYPAMPESAPEYAAWSARIARALAALHGPAVLIGHSFGASVLLKYASEATIKTPIQGMFLIAAPFWGAKGWGHDEFRLPSGFAAKLPRGARIFLYHSRDDEEVPFAHVKIYARKIPRATVRALDRRGHQFKNDVSEIVSDIQSLAMSGLNATWHRQHPMPRNPTMAQRVKWHVAHAKACGCREIPKNVLAELKAGGSAHRHLFP